MKVLRNSQSAKELLKSNYNDFLEVAKVAPLVAANKTIELRTETS